MFSSLRSKPDSVKEWYVRIGTTVFLVLILISYIIFRLKSYTGSWKESFVRIKAIGQYGVGAFSKRLEDIRAPLRPVLPQTESINTVNSDTLPIDTEVKSPVFEDVADI
jgi:hypothetical protein